MALSTPPGALSAFSLWGESPGAPLLRGPVPVNLAGMIAANAGCGGAPLAYWEDLQSSEVFLLDVRDSDEFAEGHVEGAAHIPLNELRDRLDEVPRNQPVWTYCEVGQRAYYATRRRRPPSGAATDAGFPAVHQGPEYSRTSGSPDRLIWTPTPHLQPRLPCACA